MIKNKPLVSILVANYNNEKFLSRSINSCLKQKYSNLEILVHDDNSSDNSIEKLNTFKKNSKIKIFYNKSKKQNIAALDAANGSLDIGAGSKQFIENMANGGNMMGTIGAWMFYVSGLLIAVLPLWFNPNE